MLVVLWNADSPAVVRRELMEARLSRRSAEVLISILWSYLIILVVQVAVFLCWCLARLEMMSVIGTSVAAPVHVSFSDSESVSFGCWTKKRDNIGIILIIRVIITIGLLGATKVME